MCIKMCDGCCMCVGRSHCASTIKREVRVVLVELVVKEADSYCKIPMEGNWNSIGVRSWLLP